MFLGNNVIHRTMIEYDAVLLSVCVCVGNMCVFVVLAVLVFISSVLRF